RHLAERQSQAPLEVSAPERHRILLDAAKQVGPAIFFSLLIIVVSFLPVFMLEAQEGRMFRPLAWTKTFAVGFSSLLAITLVPVLMIFFIAVCSGQNHETQFLASRTPCTCLFCAFAYATARQPC